MQHAAHVPCASCTPAQGIRAERGEQPLAYERFEGASLLPLPRSYRRREPEKSPLYAVVREHLETFLEEGRARTEHGHGYPSFIEQEFRGYLRCGILSEGFSRARCRQCGHDIFVGLSCKRRAGCPSCGARRTAETAAFLVDRLLPEGPHRQWVLTVPLRLRWLMRRDKTLLSEVLASHEPEIIDGGPPARGIRAASCR